MAQRALGLDLITRVRNIKWAGGTFVVKGLLSQIVRGTRTTWVSQNPPLNTFGGSFANSGSSTALIGIGSNQTPVFVVSAKRENDDGDEGSVILASPNGQDWQIVFEQYEVNEGSFRSPWIIDPTGIVWDMNENAFYASFRWVDFNVSTGSTPEGEALYRSTNGYDWSGVSRNMKGTMTDETPSDLVPHCNKPENTGGFPDGLQAYHVGTGRLMKPTSLFGFSPVNGALYDLDVKASVTIKRGSDTRTRNVSAPCYAVAQYGGTWVAAGGSLDSEAQTLTIDVSTNAGESWDQVYRETYNPDLGIGMPAATASANR